MLSPKFSTALLTTSVKETSSHPRCSRDQALLLPHYHVVFLKKWCHTPGQQHTITALNSKLFISDTEINYKRHNNQDNINALLVCKAKVFVAASGCDLTNVKHPALLKKMIHVEQFEIFSCGINLKVILFKKSLSYLNAF